MEADVMVIAAHPDDAEIGMGGTILSLTAAGKRVVLVDLTNGEPTPHGSPEIRAVESAEAAKILGVEKRITLTIPNRAVSDSVENRKMLANVMRQYKPKTLFIPYWDDAHPDHIYSFLLSNSARFYSKFVKGDLEFEPHFPRKMINYFSTHLRVKAIPTFIYDVSPFMEKKLEALRAYKSQFVTHKGNEFIFDALRTENGYWGNQCGCKYGEAFISREQVKIVSPQALLEL